MSDNRKCNSKAKSNFKSQGKRSRNRANANTKVSANPDEAVRQSTNDVSWYTPSEQILRDAASISYNYAAGNVLDISSRDYLYGPSPLYEGRAYSTPGVMELDTFICPGISDNNSSAINIAARQIYSYVRHANSGHSNYDAPDLMMYLMAMDSVYAMYNNLKRLYGVINLYDIKNRYLPAALVQAMGFDFDDVMHNIPNIRYYLNTVANKINTLCVPAILNVMVRHSWLFSNVYADSDLPTAQLYVFKMMNYYTYNEMVLPAKLQSHSVPVEAHALLKVSQYMKQLDDALAAIIESEDFNIMSGDILKAYGEGNLFRVSSTPDDYKLAPVVDANVLLQIDNSIVVPYLTNSDITVNPDTNTILWEPVVHQSTLVGLGYKGNWLINTHEREVTPAHTMEATRLMPVCEEKYANGKWTVKVASCGSDILAGAAIWYYDRPAPDSTELILHNASFYSAVTGFINPQYGTMRSIIEIMGLLSKFKYHPQLRAYEYYGDTSAPSFDDDNADMNKIALIATFCELDHFTVIQPEVLSRLHDTAILGEFGIKSLS